MRDHFYGTEDEGVESAPCHGEVSRCESGRSRHLPDEAIP